MARMPTSMAKNQPREHAKQAASETADEIMSEVEQLRQQADVSGGGRRTLEQLQDEARTLGEKARGKMEQMNEAVRDAAASARKNTRLPESAPVSTDAISDTVMDSLKTASEKLSAEISDLGQRVESVKNRVSESMQAAGGKAKDTMQFAGDKAKDTWHQSSEAAKNVGEREYCLPLPTDRICARHVALVGIPLVALFLLMMIRRRYPKKWKASVNKMKQPGMMLAREVPSSEKLKAKLQGAADSLEDTVEYSKQRGKAKVDEVRSKYNPPENKKEQ
ncbi:uncharacterized protein PHALS_10433 [Plasmopara halstedii]|uniref:Uncharacterized protein n=1 Tax=Plasmopara halstedii TaxID=4781 RepID=A0A0P1AGC5_PLAHL|nr:uncharacterized protein PHALS_10433 [Plasmopara halstedii]CEG40221.1 hypothetical protein PHALS_10433 [Plasmopara halstedii]|eukprot:XP_024576590.1 hypothetical protein PHALS_10433 [Plasmopara halstedii]